MTKLSAMLISFVLGLIFAPIFSDGDLQRFGLGLGLFLGGAFLMFILMADHSNRSRTWN